MAGGWPGQRVPGPLPRLPAVVLRRVVEVVPLPDQLGPPPLRPPLHHRGRPGQPPLAGGARRFVIICLLHPDIWDVCPAVSAARSLLLSSYASTDTRLPVSHRLLWAAANINCDTAALCSIVYWVFLFDRNHSLDVDNISGHILIFLVNIIDTFVSLRYKDKAIHTIHRILIQALACFARVSCPTVLSGVRYVKLRLHWGRGNQSDWSTLHLLHSGLESTNSVRKFPR